MQDSTSFVYDEHPVIRSHFPVDAIFVRGARAAGLDPSEAFRPTDDPEAGYRMDLLYGGALELSALCFLSFNDCRDIAREIIDAERDPDLTVMVGDVSWSSEHGAESRGYGPYGTYSMNEGGEIEER